MTSPGIFLYIGFSFFIAGFVKGLVGLGFPTIILAMLSLSLGVPRAMALMLLPCFATNVWQAMSGGFFREILWRIWPLLALSSVTVWFTTSLLTRLDSQLLSVLLGLVVAIYGVSGLMKIAIRPPGAHEGWLTPFFGGVTGIFTGLTGTFVFPAVLYLQSLGFRRDMLVQAMGLHFLVSTVALSAGLAGHSLLTPSLVYFSACALIPAFSGMAIGRIVRQRIPERRFQKLFFAWLMVLGAGLVARNIFV